MLSAPRLTCEIPLPIFAALLLLACDKDKRAEPSTEDTAPTHDTGPDPDHGCDTGYLDADGECVPAACGTGTWGNLEVDESTVYVDIAASEGGDGSEAAPFTSIQAGLDAAGDADGGMVAVAAGTYMETLELGYGHAGVQLAGRCRELVILDASRGDAQTPGIYAHTVSGEAEISGLVLKGSSYIGLMVTSGSLSVRDAGIVENDYTGIWVDYGPSLTLDSCLLDGNAIAGIAAFNSGSELSLVDTTIRNGVADGNGDYGFGMAVSDASLIATSCHVADNATAGIVAIGTAQVELRDSSVTDTRHPEGGSFAAGIEVYGGASLKAESCGVARSETCGVYVEGQGSEVTLVATTIGDTEPDASGGGGHGVLAMNGASLALRDCEIVGNVSTGVLAIDSGTAVSLQDTRIRDTQSDGHGNHGYGIQIYGGAALQAESCHLERNTTIGVTASNAGTELRMERTVIKGTLLNADAGLGSGLHASDGASVQATDCSVEESTMAGIVAWDAGTAVELQNTTVTDTQPNATGENAYAQGGYGIYLYSGVTMAADSCLVDGNTRLGLIALDSGTEVSLRNTSLCNTQPAIDAAGHGIAVRDGAALSAESCNLEGNTPVGIQVRDAGTEVALLDVSITGTLADESGVFGSAINVFGGGRLEAESCSLLGNAGVGVVASESGTTVVLRDTVIDQTQSTEAYTVAVGGSAQLGATVEATDLVVTSSSGPGLYAVEGGHLSCSGCTILDNQFAGAVVAVDSSLVLEGSIIESTTEQENTGGGVGIYAEPWYGGASTLMVADTTIMDNPIAGVWLSGEGSYSLSNNAIHGGEGWTREGLTKCGDAVYARDGVTAWDGSSGLLLEDNELVDGLGAGLFLDDASATLMGNSYADNSVDLVMQGSSCDVPPESYGDEALGSVELCPTYDYATCGDEFSLYLTLEEPELGYGAAFMRSGIPGPGALPALPVALPHTFDPLPLLPPAPRLEPLEFRPQPVRFNRPRSSLVEPRGQ